MFSNTKPPREKRKTGGRQDKRNFDEARGKGDRTTAGAVRDRALRAHVPGGAVAGRTPCRSIPAARSHRNGQTRTVEALAEVLHGSRKHMVRVDCGEYQLDHEVAKLIGAPPGYLGHRETHPILTQAKLAAVTSERSSLSILLFDEIEKAAPSTESPSAGSARQGDAPPGRQQRRELRADVDLSHQQSRRARHDEGIQSRASALLRTRTGLPIPDASKT